MLVFYEKLKGTPGHVHKATMLTLLKSLLLCSPIVVLLQACSPMNLQQNEAALRQLVNAVVLPIKEQYDLPGVAVGVTVRGRHQVFNYGLAVKEGSRPVTDATLFEVGSISKTFTATLAALAEERHKLSMDDGVCTYLPELQGSPFCDTTLIQLATHVQGGFPLQVPAEIASDAQLYAYLRGWRPHHSIGTRRTYSNISTGLLGRVAARSLQGDFVTLMHQQVLAPLGMGHTFYNVPPASMADYAQGYTAQGSPIRVAAGPLHAESYGIKTTAADLLRFVDANLGVSNDHGELAHAMAHPHVGYFQVGEMVQGMMWEQNEWPVSLEKVLSGSSREMVYTAMPASRLMPRRPAQSPILVHKTGATNGFAAYVAFVPEKQVGIVILANKGFPNEERIRAAHQILTRLKE